MGHITAKYDVWVYEGIIIINHTGYNVIHNYCVIVYYQLSESSKDTDNKVLFITKLH